MSPPCGQHTSLRELPSEELLFAKGGAGQVDRWTLGTKLATTPLPPSLPRPAPKYAAGIMAHFEAVVQQWRQVRGVTPLRVVLAGPPMAGVCLCVCFFLGGGGCREVIV